MIRRFPYRPFIVPTIAAYVLLALGSCSGSGASAKEFRRYDPLPYADTFTFIQSPDVVYRAAVAALQDRGAVISLSDPSTGLISAELHSEGVLPEDAYASKAADDGKDPGSGVLAVLGTILGVILFVLLFSWLSDGCSGGCAPGTTVSSPSPPEPVKAYKYVVSVNLLPSAGASTEMRISAIRQLIENGTVTSSQRMQNKYLNYSLRDAVEASLVR
jgi:hypothetical protein